MNTTSASLLHQLRDPARQGDAWRRFTDLYVPILYRMARRLDVRPEEAADLVQDVLLVLVRTMPEFVYDPGRSFRAWIKTILTNRWRERHRRRPPMQADSHELAGLATPDPLDQFTEQEYLRHLVHRLLPRIRTQVPPSEWRIFERTLLAGETNEVVAADLGIQLSSVYAARSRVLKRLREELTGLIE